MEFFLGLAFGLAWCLSGYMAWKIGGKMDQKNYGWQDQVLGFILGPIGLILLSMEYFKRRKRAKYAPHEMVNRKKDIYDLWDWFFGEK